MGVLTKPRLPVDAMPADTSWMVVAVLWAWSTPESDASNAPYFSAELTPSVVLKMGLAVPVSVTVVTGLVVIISSKAKADPTTAFAILTCKLPSAVRLLPIPPSMVIPALSAAMVVMGLMLMKVVPPLTLATAISLVLAPRFLALPEASSL